MWRYLLDTCILSEPQRSHPDPDVLGKLAFHQNRICTASVVWHELVFGIERLPPSRRRDNLQRYLLEVVAVTIPVLSYDEKAAAWHARQRALLAGHGQTPPFADGQIAATACVNDLVLVTRNLRDYARFPELRVEVW